jgi:hypothetical protein
VTRPFGADVLAYVSNELDQLLAVADAELASAYPGDSLGRQPVHTAYVPAQHFGPGVASLWGAQAIAALEEFAPEPGEFAAAMELAPEIAAEVRPLVLAKLAAVDREVGADRQGHAGRVKDQAAILSVVDELDRAAASERLRAVDI